MFRAMADLPPEDLATIERGRRAFVNRNRDVFLATLDPNIVVENLSDWPGPSRVQGSAEVWDNYADVFDQFDVFDMQYPTVEKVGDAVVIEVHCELTGLGSGAPAELRWTMAGEFDSRTQRFTSVRWFHSRAEAIASLST
jgi:hypothetical protein